MFKMQVLRNPTLQFRYTGSCLHVKLQKNSTHTNCLKGRQNSLLLHVHHSNSYRVDTSTLTTTLAFVSVLTPSLKLYKPVNYFEHLHMLKLMQVHVCGTALTPQQSPGPVLRVSLPLPAISAWYRCNKHSHHSNNWPHPLTLSRPQHRWWWISSASSHWPRLRTAIEKPLETTSAPEQSVGPLKCECHLDIFLYIAHCC